MSKKANEETLSPDFVDLGTDPEGGRPPEEKKNTPPPAGGDDAMIAAASDPDLGRSVLAAALGPEVTQSVIITTPATHEEAVQHSPEASVLAAAGPDSVDGISFDRLVTQATICEPLDLDRFRFETAFALSFASKVDRDVSKQIKNAAQGSPRFIVLGRNETAQLCLAYLKEKLGQTLQASARTA